MSILMYDSINQQCSVNRGGGKGVCGESASTGLRMKAEPSSRTMAFCVLPSLPISLFLQLQLLPMQVYTAGGYSLENKLGAYLQLSF